VQKRTAPAPAEQQPVPASDADEWKDKYLRAQADLANTKKRLERRYANEAARQTDALLRDVLPLADNLERALAHNNGDTAAEGLHEGVRLTLKALNAMLAKYDVQAMPARGQPFDPARHEAVSVIQHPEVAPGTIAQVEQTGYMVGDRVLRPARVVVAAEQ